jgi:pantoate kinase
MRSKTRAAHVIEVAYRVDTGWKLGDVVALDEYGAGVRARCVDIEDRGLTIRYVFLEV